MRFSLKDLFVSFTLASLGIALLTLLFKTNDTFGLPGPFVAFLSLILSLLPGALIGAAIGRLFQRGLTGFWTGILLQVVLLGILSVFVPYPRII